MLKQRAKHGASYLNPTAKPSPRGVSLIRGGRAFLIALLALLLIAADSAADESLQNQRERFQIAERALQTGNRVNYAALQAYPLYPYLRYRDLARRLVELPADEVRHFLQNYPDTPLTRQLRNAWLRQLARSGRWDDYLRDAIPSNEPTFECWRRHALLATGQTESALDNFASIWLRGSALPTACDPITAAWRTHGGLGPALLWQRFALATLERNLSLARMLRAELATADQTLADTWLAIANNPPLLADPARLSLEDSRNAPLINAALKWWGKRDLLAAIATLDALKARQPALASHWLSAERDLALWIATDYHPSALARLTALTGSAVDGPVREWRVRVCLRQGDWPLALQWLDQLSAAEQQSLRWQYWRARVLELLGRAETARPLYQTLARQRDYHGFLAAERLGVAYAMTATPLAIPAAELGALLDSTPGLRRARELYILGRESEAEAEWRQATRNFDRATLERAALLAHRWDWHPQAIATLARAESWDDLEIRFPLAYREAVVQQTSASPINPAWVYAVIRQESSYRATARSPVGALGLMQLMPATGQEMARLLGDNNGGTPPLLLQPEINIRLGVRYLQKILADLQNNPLLATAAYNAGPNRVARWLPTTAPLPADLWAETIPYQETRSYVQRVLEYAAIYTHRLGLPQSPLLLGAWMKPVQPPKPIANSAITPHLVSFAR